MKRARFIVALAIFGSLAMGCEAILGLHDRTLRDGGADASEDALDATTACDGEFCSCHPHAFCDDFDFYSTVTDLQQKWQVPTFGSSVFQIGGSLVLDNSTGILPPTTPNALLATVLLPSPLNGAGFVVGQVDASTPNVSGIIVTVQMRVVSLDPADGAPPLLDSGIMLFGAVLAVVDFTSKNGVGVALSEQGAYMGYALNVLSLNARLAQGKQFLALDPATLTQYIQVQLVVAKRSSMAIPTSVDCTPGPVLSDVDASVSDAALADPVVAMVSTGVTPPSCEVLSAELADSAWLSSPVLLLGSVVKGQGVFSVDFDNFTVDFVTN